MSNKQAIVNQRIVINSDLDIITARLRAREVARQIGFGTIDQARISLAASELARILTLKMKLPGEIVIAGVQTADHIGIQVTSIDSNDPQLAQTATQAQAVLPDSALTNAISLVDEGFVEEVGGNNTRVTLMKWLL